MPNYQEQFTPAENMKRFLLRYRIQNPTPGQNQVEFNRLSYRATMLRGSIRRIDPDILYKTWRDYKMELHIFDQLRITNDGNWVLHPTKNASEEYLMLLKELISLASFANLTEKNEKAA